MLHRPAAGGVQMVKIGLLSASLSRGSSGNFSSAGSLLAIALAALLLLPLQAQAGNYEAAPTFSPEKILPRDLVTGPHHTIEGRVTNDGLMNRYQMRTDYGTFVVEGTELLRLRVRELSAASKLDEVGSTETMVDAAGRTVLKPFGTARRLLTAPGKTVSDSARGVGRWFGRVGASLSATDPGREGTIGSITGGSAARRKLAYDFGVDPYTSFKPLDQQLRRLATASAVGGSLTSVGLAFVSGGAGIAISVGSTSSTLRALLRDKSAAELEEIGRRELVSMGVDEGDIDVFYKNPSLSPTDKAVIVESLLRLGNVSGRDVFVRRATQASSPSEGFFHRRRAELMAAYHQRVAPLHSFVSLAGVPIAQTSKGLIGIFPVDFVSWTRSLDGLISQMNRDRRAVAGQKGAEMWITGVATKRTVAGLRRAGWRMTHRVGAKLGN